MAQEIRKYSDIFIDFDDTLYDTRNNAIIALKELYDAMHFDEQGIEEEKFYDIYWQTNMYLWGKYSKGEITRDELIVERFRKPLHEASCKGINPTVEYCLEVSDKFLDLCSVKSGLIDGARELVDYLRSQGYRLHLCSNGFHEVQYKKLASCGLKECFDTIVLSEDAGANKPSPAFFDYALKVTGASRNTTLMIGDNYNSDIEGALDSNIDAMLYQRWDPTFEPPRPVNYIVNTLKEITDIL